MNITITILSNTLIHQQVSRLLPQAKVCSAFSGFPNDWLSPTNRLLGNYGVGQRGDLHPIPFDISRAWENPAAGEPLTIFVVLIILLQKGNVNREFYVEISFAPWYTHGSELNNKRHMTNWNGQRAHTPRIPAVPSRRRRTLQAVKVIGDNS